VVSFRNVNDLKEKHIVLLPIFIFKNPYLFLMCSKDLKITQFFSFLAQRESLTDAVELFVS